jgi:hypothetical protein
LEGSGKSSKNDENEYKSSLGGRSQKLIGALNSAGIGGAKPKQFSNSFHKKLVRSGKSSKNEENQYNSSLGGHSQKPIGALNSAGIGGAEPKNF